MSSLTRRIARGADKNYRPGSIHEKGLKVGVPTDPKSKDLVARLKREKKREDAKGTAGA